MNFNDWFDKQLDNENAFSSDEPICKQAWQAAEKHLQQNLALKDLEIMRLREALEQIKNSVSEDWSRIYADEALSTPATYDDLMAWHNEQLGEPVARVPRGCLGNNDRLGLVLVIPDDYSNEEYLPLYAKKG